MKSVAFYQIADAGGIQRAGALLIPADGRAQTGDIDSGSLQQREILLA